MENDAGLWSRSGAWRWTLVLASLATAIVVLIGPWNKHSPSAPNLASYQAPPGASGGTQAAIVPGKQVNIPPPGFYDTDFDLAITLPKASFQSGTELHVIGVYEGALPKGETEKPWWANCSSDKSDKQAMIDCHRKYAGIRTERTIEVSVTKSSAPIVLVLMSYNPVKWRITQAPGTNIQKIILSGYHGQDIEGSFGNIPVEVHSYESSPCQICSRQGGYFYAFEQNSREYATAIDMLQTLTGLSPTSFQGVHRSDRFSISSGTPSLPLSSQSSGITGQMDVITGRDFVDHFKIANTDVALPEGQWRGIVFFKNPTGRGSDEFAVLARIEKNQVLELIAVRSQLATDGRGFSRYAACERKESYTRKVELNEPFGTQLCFWLNHVTEPWAQPIFGIAAKRLTALGATAPSLLINTGFHKADKTSSLTVHYLTSPASKGIVTPQTTWDASPWHSNNLTRFPDNEAYVRNQIRWGESWFQIFKATKS